MPQKPKTPKELPDLVWNEIDLHFGEYNRITKETIAMRIFGKYNENIDRQIRDSVEILITREDSKPICATSDKAGYFIARTMNEASQTLRELQSRREAIQAKERGIIRGITGMNAGQTALF